MIRRTPLRRKAAKPKRRLAGCPIRRCKRYPYRRGECDNLCVVHLRRALDKMAREKALEKHGLVCAALGYLQARGLICSADSGTPSVQWAHIVRRGRGITRWLDGNARPLCAAHHTYFTHSPEAWVLFIDELIGFEAHSELIRMSLADAKVDLKAEWDRLTK